MKTEAAVKKLLQLFYEDFLRCLESVFLFIPIAVFDIMTSGKRKTGDAEYVYDKRSV